MPAFSIQFWKNDNLKDCYIFADFNVKVIKKSRINNFLAKKHETNIHTYTI